jgi:cytochrome c biogenesis protein CcmG/thiol:disulfide interchange protein DsbE
MEPSRTTPVSQSHRKRSPAWIAAAVIGSLVVGLLAFSVSSHTSTPPQEGSPVPLFQLTSFDDQPMELDAQPGEITVINFFASWCAPCRQEAADLERSWRLYEDKEVQFYGIAYKDAASRAQGFLAEFDVSYPSGEDPGNRTARAYGVTGVPETFVVDAQGHLVKHFLGPITQAQLSTELDQLLAP